MVAEGGMRVLVLGAGALGAYFGGRLVEAGTAEVAFLVRPARAAALGRDGLRIESPFGAWQGAVATLTAEQARPGWDVVLLACKAYDLDDAIAAIRPAVDSRTAILPVLNGIAHLDGLDAAFGSAQVLGGLARIQATLAPDGTVRQLNDWRWLTFGERNGTPSPRARAIEAAFAPARGVEAQAVPDIAARMWEKLVHLGTAAAGTVLMRASIGEIVRAGGTGLLHRLLDRNAAIAAARGFPMREAFLAEFRTLFSDATSAYSTSMLRDLEAGGRIEAEHILGWLLQAAREAGIADELHEAALLHARAYAERRAAGRLPRG
jgi:2-dehydropantoate 2-reductase